MDMNPYALEIMVRDRLDRFRAEAAVHALTKPSGARPPRSRARVGLGLLLISLGRWLRRDDCREAVGARRGPTIA